MHLLRGTFLFQFTVIRRNRWTFILVLLTSAAVLWYGHVHGRSVKAIAYLIAMGLGIFITDLFARWKTNAPLMPVRRPTREAFWVLLCIGLGLFALFARFVLLDWSHVPGLVRLAFLPLFACVFPIAIAIIMLAMKYKPRELGFRWSASAWVFAPVLVLTALTARIVAPQEFTFGEMFKSEGLLPMLYEGFILAALSEEFTRLLLQTRMAAVLKNSGIAWFLASVLWAGMHIPKWLGDEGNAFEAVMGAVRIVPLGLLWGYMTHRTRSIFPAILVHGMNVWGLQNF